MNSSDWVRSAQGEFASKSETRMAIGVFRAAIILHPVIREILRLIARWNAKRHFHLPVQVVIGLHTKISLGGCWVTLATGVQGDGRRGQSERLKR